MEKVGFKYKNKKISLEAKSCNLFRDMIGLMFSSREKAKALLFEFKKPTMMSIHSYFVFFPFIAVWINEKEKVIDLQIIKPWTSHIRPKKPFTKLVEIPINKRYKKIANSLVGNTKSL